MAKIDGTRLPPPLAPVLSSLCTRKSPLETKLRNWVQSHYTLPLLQKEKKKSRGFSAAEFPWEHVSVITHPILCGAGVPLSQCHRMLAGGLGQGQQWLFGHQLSLPEIEFQAKAAFFFSSSASNLKATLQSKDASGTSGMDFYVVQ